MTEPGPPQGRQLSPHDAAYRRCPHAIVASVGHATPGHWDAEFDRFVLTGFQAARRMLLRQDVSVAPRLMRGRPADAQPGPFEHTLLQQDPPESALLRGVISRALSTASLDGARSAIMANARELLDGLGDPALLEVHSGYALPLACRTIADLLGIERSLHARVGLWATDLAPTFDPFAPGEDQARMQEAHRALLQYFRQRCAAVAPAAGAQDLVSRLVATAATQEEDLETVASTCVLLLGAGITTTADLITNGLRLLLTHGRELDRLRADPGLMAGAVEEALRLEPPVAQFSRIARQTLQIEGVEIPAGAGIAVWVVAAGCDPAVHQSPLVFDIARQQHSHLAFAAGVHTCPGSQLARLETAAAWHVLLDRFPGLRLADAPAQRRVNLVLNGWNALDVHTR